MKGRKLRRNALAAGKIYGHPVWPGGRRQGGGKSCLARRTREALGGEDWARDLKTLPIGIEGELSVETKALDHTDLVNQIIDVIVKEGMVDRDKVTLDATIESLDLKSIDIVMILTAIEEKFDVYIPMDGPFHEAKDIKSLIDAIAAYIVKEKS